MKRNLTTILLTSLALVLTALPAAGQEPFPPADWQHTARFSGDQLYASFEWSTDDFSYINIFGFDGNFRFPGVKGKATADQLVSAIFESSTCDADGVRVQRSLFGAKFSGGALPVYNAETHEMHAALAMGGVERVYETDGCSWEGQNLLAEDGILAMLDIEGYFVTEKCKGRCYAVCEFVGSMSLQYDSTDLLEGKQFDTVGEGFGGNRRGDIFWWAPPGA